MKYVTIQIDVGITIPDNIPEEEIQLIINDVNITHKGQPIEKSSVTYFTNNGPVDCFTES